MPVYQNKDKNGKIIKDKKGKSWYYRCYYTDIYGNRKQKESKKYLLQSEAKDAERDFLTNINKSENEIKSVAFEKVYDDFWDIKKSALKCTSYYRKKGGTDLYILKELKSFKLSQINSEIIKKWRQNFINKKYSVKYTNEFISYLKEILYFASEKYGYNVKNAIFLQKIRDDSVKEIKSDAEWNFWTYDQFHNFIKTVDDENYYLMYTFLYFTGLRFGEFNALNWNDIDFKSKTLNVNKSLSNKIKGQKYVITTPKTANSVRIIDLDDNLINLLKKHLERENNVYNFNKSMFVFGNVNYISYTSFCRKLNFYIEKSNIGKKITPHGFRHSHVSFLIDIGCDVRDVAERIGDTVEIVEKTYYHMFPNKKSKTVNAINDFNKKNKR